MSASTAQPHTEHVWLKTQKWWKKGLIYQIYPRSYKDSNGDGVGDLKGIIEKLDYIKSLYVDAVWLSPIFPSPMADFGYDISDYVGVHPIFGTMEDFDLLLQEIHSRGMKLILDLVPNHTSDQHPWFLESRSSKTSPLRDYYIWRDPKPDGGPPNNWRSFFGGSAWTLDEQTGQYYLHQFLKEQPELNHRHPDVFPKMMDNVRFWLNKGVDGFRVDVIWCMIKDELLRDEPTNPNWDGVNPFEELQHVHTQNVEGIHDLVKQMRKVFDEYPDRMMVGEIYLPYEELMKYYGKELDECHLPFNFKLITIKWTIENVRHFINEYEAMLPKGCWPNWVLGNHDQPRVGKRVGLDQRRVANMLLLTLRGTPTTYFGEEIGMQQANIPFEKMKDPNALNQPKIAHIVGRDGCRTPMQWDNSPNAGFCPPAVEPWLPVEEHYESINVELEEKDPKSILSMYRALARLRHMEPSLSVGRYGSLSFADPAIDSEIFCYERGAHPADHLHEHKHKEEHPDIFVIILNFGDKHFPSLDLYSALARKHGEQGVIKKPLIELSTHMDREKGNVDISSLTLRPHEGLVVRFPVPLPLYTL